MNLNDLILINRRFGGHSVIRKALAQLAAGSDKFTLLDVGAASGDTARLIKKIYPAARVTSLDYSFINLKAAPSPKLIANAFELPFSSGSFDYVMASLFLHHFADEQVVALLRNLYIVAKRALLVCDLERNVLPYCFLPITKPLFGWTSVTVHDGRISVRAAFRIPELLELSKKAGINNADATSYRPAFRIALIARKNARV